MHHPGAIILDTNQTLFRGQLARPGEMQRLNCTFSQSIIGMWSLNKRTELPSLFVPVLISQVPILDCHLSTPVETHLKLKLKRKAQAERLCHYSLCFYAPLYTVALSVIIRCGFVCHCSSFVPVEY